MARLKARIRQLEKRRGSGLIFALVIVKEGDSVEDAWAQWDADHPVAARHPEWLFRWTIHVRTPRRSAS